MTASTASARQRDIEVVESVELRVRGRVQGVGFRPFVWRLARELGLSGSVWNDAEGVLIRACGSAHAVRAFRNSLEASPPPLASIEAVEVSPYEGGLPPGFEIAESRTGRPDTQVGPGAATCADCAAEIADPFSRRYRYPFTTCTNCGPRLTVVSRMPYDRINTSLAPFDLCTACNREYLDPADRRFHAETIACHACGPRARLLRLDGKAVSFEQSSMLDDVDGARGFILKGEIVALKALGGYQIACDATRSATVAELRRRKQRDRKPFALMAAHIDIIRRYCTVTPAEEALLQSPEAPIVLLEADGPERLPEDIAPGLRTLGFMLPSSPLHELVLRRIDRPVVMTSGNVSNAPQIIGDEVARTSLGSIATYALMHDRDILNRVDDSVVRLAAGKPRLIRRARGYAPAPIRLPRGLVAHPEIMALGGDLKSVFCFARAGSVVLSQHIGDLDDAATNDDLAHAITLYRDLLHAQPQLVVADMHPGYRSSAFAERIARQEGLPLVKVQHHHAHVAACLAENGRAADARPVLGIALDGLGYGANGEIWGGEFLLADYVGYERLATFKPVAMLGGDQASREPWRNLYAHLVAEIGWAEFQMNFRELPVFEKLAEKPRKLLDAMLRDGMQAPLASSCGRLFDAVAAALDLCFEAQAYEGEAAMRLEAIACRETLANGDPQLDYPFTIPNLKGSRLPYIEPLAVWNAILGDLLLDTPRSVMSARFHRGLAKAIAGMAIKLARRDSEDGPRFDTIALSGGCFNNRILLERVETLLGEAGFGVLTHTLAPAGDGGLALGQAAIAAARSIKLEHQRDKQGDGACASESPAAS